MVGGVMVGEGRDGLEGDEERRHRRRGLQRRRGKGGERGEMGHRSLRQRLQGGGEGGQRGRKGGEGVGQRRQRGGQGGDGRWQPSNVGREVGVAEAGGSGRRSGVQRGCARLSVLLLLCPLPLLVLVVALLTRASVGQSASDGQPLLSVRHGPVVLIHIVLILLLELHLLPLQLLLLLQSMDGVGEVVEHSRLGGGGRGAGLAHVDVLVLLASHKSARRGRWGRGRRGNREADICSGDSGWGRKHSWRGSGEQRGGWS